MMLIHNVEGSFDIGDQSLSILDLDSELFLESFMNLDWGLNICKATFVSPVGIESDWNTLYSDWFYIPSIRVDGI